MGAVIQGPWPQPEPELPRKVRHLRPAPEPWRPPEPPDPPKRTGFKVTITVECF